MDTDPRREARPELVFWSDFTLGFHNREAEEKMARFAARGYRVHYVEKIGIRNPRLRHIPWMLRALTRTGQAPAAHPFHVVSPKLALPRRAPLVPRLNRTLLERQVVAHLQDAPGAIFWVRYPSPELPALLDSVRPRLVVYEAVDDHEHGPGISSRLRPLLRRAEDALLARAGLVFVWSEALREQFAPRHPNVVVAGPAIDLARFSAVAAQNGDARVAVWTGAIDFRFDATLLAEAADRLGDWRFVLAGPVLERRAEHELAAHRNVELLGEVAPDAVPGLLARARVCVMPYRQSEFTDNLFPMKLVEYLATGRRVVSTPIRIAREMDDVVVTADSAAAFATAIGDAEHDTDEARGARIDRAAAYSWDARINQMDRAVQEALRDA